MPKPERGGTFRSALTHRDYRYLLASLAVSETGNWLYSAASVIYVLRATGSPAWIGVIAVVRMVPFIVLEPIGGAIADRYDRRKVMIASDLARACVMAVIAVVSISETVPAVAAVAILAFVNNVLASPYFPAVTAITPAVVPERDLAAANALSGTIDNFALAFGPGLSALLLLVGPPPIAFAANAATFLFSAAMVWRMRTGGRVGQVEVEASIRSRVADGARAIRGSREAVLLVALTAAFGFTFGQEVVLFGPIADDLLGTGIDSTGLLFAAPGIGGIVAASAAARLASRSRTSGILAVATFVSGIPLTTLAFVHVPTAAYLLLTVEGAAVIIADVVTTTTLQRIVPHDRIGSAFGVLGAASVGAIALGSLVAPVTIGLFGLRGATLLAGGLLLGITVAMLPGARAIDRRAAARAEELAPGVAVLQRVDIFEAASPQQLEGLAAASTEEAVPAGTVVLREGDEPDDLYVVVNGTLEASAIGPGGVPTVLSRVGSGGYFGEIGLLEKRPRTATVTVVEDARFLRIPGDEFLAIVNEGPQIARTLAPVVARRLAASHPHEDLGHA